MAKKYAIPENTLWFDGFTTYNSWESFYGWRDMIKKQNVIYEDQYSGLLENCQLEYEISIKKPDTYCHGHQDAGSPGCNFFSDNLWQLGKTKISIFQIIRSSNPDSMGASGWKKRDQWMWYSKPNQNGWAMEPLGTAGCIQTHQQMGYKKPYLQQRYRLIHLRTEPSSWIFNP